MATKFKLLKEATRAAVIQEAADKKLYDILSMLHESDQSAVQMCIEGLVDILGTVHARMSNGKDPLDNIQDPRHKKILMGVIAAAKILKDHPGAVDAHNMNPNKLRQVMAGAGDNLDATRMLLQVAQSAPKATSDVVQQIQQYTQAVERGDEQTMSSIAKEFQKLWVYWQRQTASR